MARHEVALDAVGGPHENDLDLRIQRTIGIGHRQRGMDVARRAAGGDGDATDHASGLMVG